MLNQKEYDALVIATSLREFNGYENTEELTTSLNSAMPKYSASRHLLVNYQQN